MRRGKQLSSESWRRNELAIGQFNRRHPAGSQVRIWHSQTMEGPGEIATVGEAGAHMFSGTPMVQVEGRLGCIFLSRVKPLDHAPGAVDALQPSQQGAEARHG